MNKFDEFYDFELATINDADKIMEFLKDEWKENHILANNKNFILWMYGNEHFGDFSTLNFVVMKDKNGKIVGLNGFVPYSCEKERLCVSSAITKVKSNLPVPMTGVELIKRFKQIVGAKKYYSYGTNPKTMIPIGQKIFKYYTGFMSQYYMLNPQFTTFDIAQIKNKKNVILPKSFNVQLVKIDEIKQLYGKFDFEQVFFNQGYKSKEYIEKRYFNHPVYKYDVYCVVENDEFKALMVCREISIHESKIYRIVDWIGDPNFVSKIGENLSRLLIDNKYEYIDLLTSGFPDKSLFAAGFVLRGEYDENIIPTYFEPFVRENINIWYQKSDENVIIFKADGDQDRPNFI